MPNRVTVAIPVFNGMPHVKTAIQSVLDQSYTDLDIVVIDNDSTDGTPEYVESLEDSRVRLIRNETNIGLEGNWNKAFEEAHASPYWKMVCADDLIYPNAIATEVAALEANPEAVMTASKRAIIDDNDRTIIKARGLLGLNGLVDGPGAIRRSVLSGTNILGEPTGVLVRSKALLDSGPFDATHQFLIDFDMWARVLQRGKLFAIPQTLAAFRVGALSNSGAIAKKQRSHQIGEFKKLAQIKELGLRPWHLAPGIGMAFGVAFARRVFYALFDRRKQSQRGGSK